MRWRQLSLALATVSAVGLGSADRLCADNPPILSQGGEIFVKFVGYSAVLRSELWFFGNTNPGPDQTPFTGATQFNGAYLFTNQSPDASAAGGQIGTLPTGSPTGNLNTVTFGGIFAPGSELHFGLYVQNLYKPGYYNNVIFNELGVQDQGAWFYTGLAGNNPDNRVHTVVTQLSPYHYVVGFEDSCLDPSVPQTGALDCTNTRFTSDWDFNDHVFEIYLSPEPVTMTLMATGLLGLAGLARRRRREIVEA